MVFYTEQRQQASLSTKEIISARQAAKEKAAGAADLLAAARQAIADNQKYGDLSALMEASREGHTEKVRLLLDSGDAVDEKNKNGSTALILAIEYSSMEGAQARRST